MKRLYTALLLVYPRWFRNRYRAELIAAFEADRLDAWRAGPLGAARFYAHMVVDVMVSAFRVHQRARGVPKVHQPSGGVVEGMVRDLRQAARQLRTRPGFTAVAVLSLALGIGGR